MTKNTQLRSAIQFVIVQLDVYNLQLDKKHHILEIVICTIRIIALLKILRRKSIIFINHHSEIITNVNSIGLKVIIIINAMIQMDGAQSITKVYLVLNMLGNSLRQEFVLNKVCFRQISMLMQDGGITSQNITVVHVVKEDQKSQPRLLKNGTCAIMVITI